MKINTQTVNFNADATLIDFLDNRVQKLDMFFDHIIDVDVFLKVENTSEKENKIAAHLAVLLTFLILIGLIKPFIASLGREDLMATLRVGLMIASTVWAMISFIQSFRAARKARKA